MFPGKSVRKFFVVIPLLTLFLIHNVGSRADIYIGLLDTGVNSDVLSSSFLLPSSGWNFIEDNDDTTDTSPDLHGTAMANILNSESGNAFIIPIRTATGNRDWDSAVADSGLNFANTTTVSDNSVDIILRPNSAENPASTASLVSATNAGKLLVLQAGNHSSANPVGDAQSVSSLSGRGIIAGALDENDNLMPISNRAGDQAEWFVTAPGFSSFYSGVGTSIAATKTAALAARIMSAFPQLTAEEVGEIIRTTSTDLGASGVDKTYGWGKINPEKALLPIGEIVTAVEIDEDSEEDLSEEESTSETNETDSETNTSSESSSGSGAAIALGALVVGGIGYALIANNPDLKETLIIDEYGRAYELDLETRVIIHDSGPSAQSIIKDTSSEQIEEKLIQRSDLQLTSTYQAKKRRGFWQIESDRYSDHDDSISMALSLQLTKGVDSALAINQSLSAFKDKLAGIQGIASSKKYFMSPVFTKSSASFTNEGYHGGWGLTSKNGFSAGVSFNSVENHDRYTLSSNESTIITGYAGSNFGLGLKLTLLEEDGNLLGSSPGGPFGVDSSETLIGDFGFHINMKNTWSFVGKYKQSLTDVNESIHSFLGNFTQIRGDSWGIGLIGHNVMSHMDIFGIAMSQPFRTRNGSVDISVPKRSTQSSQTRFQTKKTDLVPNGRELSFEIFYKRLLSTRSSFTTYLIHRDQPMHRRSNRTKTTVFAVWKISFY